MNRLLTLLTLLAVAAASPARAAGGLTVESRPAGGAVLVNGAPAGLTPLTLAGLPAGSVTVVVSSPGFGIFSKQVKIRNGKVAKVKAKLKKPRFLAEAQKTGARAAVERSAALSAEWKGLIGLVAGLYGDLDLGIFGRGPAAAAFETESGYYVDITVSGGGFGDLEVVADFYLDEALTQPAGQMSLTTDLLSLTADYAFTAGAFAGSNAHLEGVASLFGDVIAAGSGTFSDGTAWTTTLAISLTDTSLDFEGALDLTYADATTAHWDVEGSITGSDVLITTSGGYVLDVHLNDDGSGGGTVVGPGSGPPLGVITWDVDGTGTILYADGSSDSFHLYL